MLAPGASASRESERAYTQCGGPWETKLGPVGGEKVGEGPGEGLQAARGLAWELGHSAILPTPLLPAPPAPSPPKAEPFLLPLPGCSSWLGPGKMGPSFLKAHAGPLMTRLVAPEPPTPTTKPLIASECLKRGVAGCRRKGRRGGGGRLFYPIPPRGAFTPKPDRGADTRTRTPGPWAPTRPSCFCSPLARGSQLLPLLSTALGSWALKGWGPPGGLCSQEQTPREGITWPLWVMLLRAGQC